MAPLATRLGYSCAIEVWVATALLHLEKPDQDAFTIQEIVTKAAEINLNGEVRSGVSVHASQHCVANMRPNPAKLRMLYATGKHTRRLLLPGDDAAPGRTGRILPDADELPRHFRYLLDWAEKRYQKAAGGGMGLISNTGKAGPTPSGLKNAEIDRLIGEGNAWLERLLKLRLAGAHLADGVDPDDHVRELREGWE